MVVVQLLKQVTELQGGYLVERASRHGGSGRLDVVVCC